jgi:hypothetical protein
MITATEYVFGLGMGRETDQNVTHGDSALAIFGAWLVNGLDVRAGWNETPDGDGFTLVILRSSTGRVLSVTTVEQHVTHVGIPG